MSVNSRVRTWWRAVRHEDVVGAQVEEELRFHIESRAEDLMRGGMSRDEALRRAKAELGSVAAARENSRQAWGTRWIDEVRGDLRHAIRLLANSPGFALIAVGSLALGIGANTVIFSAAQHMLLDRLDVPHPEQLRLLEWSEPQDGVVQAMWGSSDGEPGGGQRSTSFSYPVYHQLRKANQSLADICAFKEPQRMAATINGQTDAITGEMVSGNFYSTLQLQPQLGRGIQESDDGEVGSGPVVVISDAFWSKRFGRSPKVIGKTILINSKPMTIVGVNPAGFTGAYSAQEHPDIFLPFSMQPVVAPQALDPTWPASLLVNKDLWWVLMMGRVKPGVSTAAAQAALNVQLSAAVRGTMTVNKDSQVPRLILTDGSRGLNPYADDMSKPIKVLLGLTGFVLLLACANLATLLLARAGARQREMCVRLALGAGRRRILRQVLTESLLLSCIGGAAGLLLAIGMGDMIPRLISNSPTPPSFHASFQSQWHIFGFTAAISIMTGLVFGVVPAFHAMRVQVSGGLKDAAQTATHRRRGLTGKAIVVLQVAISMLLVVGAGLFVESLARLGNVPVGFRTHNLLLFSLEMPKARYSDKTTIPAIRQMEEKLAAVPGVQSATVLRFPLISGGAWNTLVVPEGRHYKPDERHTALVNGVGQDFFSTFHIGILQGRAFNAGDTESAPKVAVVNQSFVKEYFPNVNPIGRTIAAGGGDHSSILRIVGVCTDAKYYSLQEAAQATFYRPYEQIEGMTDPTFAIATRMKGTELLPSLRDAVQSVDRNLPLLDVRTQDEQIAESLQQPRIFADLTGAFGVLALVLACIGIYGITAYSVSQRTNEIGIRMALGAEPGRMLRMVLSEASWLTLIGVVAGLGGALALGRVIANLLYGLKAWDPLTLAGSAVLLLAVALAAGWVPAHRAARVDPMQALRHE